MKKVLVIFVLIFMIILIGDTHSQQQSWTLLTLKEYFDRRLEAMDKAVTKAEQATEKRFENTNEWRSSYEDLIVQMQSLIQAMQRDYMPRTEMIGLERQITELKERVDKMENMKSGGNVVYAYATSVVSFIIAIASFGFMLYRKNQVR